MSAAARARRLRRKRDPYAKGAQLAPVHRIEPVACAREGCGHLRGMHDRKGCITCGALLSDYPCLEYMEAS